MILYQRKCSLYFHSSLPLFSDKDILASIFLNMAISQVNFVRNRCFSDYFHFFLILLLFKACRLKIRIHLLKLLSRIKSKIWKKKKKELELSRFISVLGIAFLSNVLSVKEKAKSNVKSAVLISTDILGFARRIASRLTIEILNSLLNASWKARLS